MLLVWGVNGVPVNGPLLPVLQASKVVRKFLYADFCRKMGFVIKGVDQLLRKDSVWGGERTMLPGRRIASLCLWKKVVSGARAGKAPSELNQTDTEWLSLRDRPAECPGADRAVLACVCWITVAPRTLANIWLKADLSLSLVSSSDPHLVNAYACTSTGIRSFSGGRWQLSGLKHPGKL